MTNHYPILLAAVVLTFTGCQDGQQLPRRGSNGATTTSSSSSGNGGMGGQGGASTGGMGGMGGNGGMLPAPYCGDFVIDSNEECDDGNNEPGDGCASDCLVESSEKEPNDTAAEATVFGANSTYFAKIESKDIDYVKYSVVGSNASLLVRILDVGDGACAKGFIDSYVDILSADGTTILSSDDDAGEGSCSRAVLATAPIGDYFVRIQAAPKNMLSSFIYRLRIDEIENICGDGTITPAEECDDGNSVSGDGCSANCTIEVNDVEPNNTAGTANTFTAPWNAVLNPAGDVDVVRVDLANAANTFTATTTDQGTGACAAKTLDTIVEILKSDGTTVLASGDDIVGNCGSALVTNPAAGTYFVRIKGGSLATYPSAYGLQIIIQ